MQTHMAILHISCCFFNVFTLRNHIDNIYDHMQYIDHIFKDSYLIFSSISVILFPSTYTIQLVIEKSILYLKLKRVKPDTELLSLYVLHTLYQIAMVNDCVTLYITCFCIQYDKAIYSGGWSAMDGGMLAI
jgi:hypothetical protein